MKVQPRSSARWRAAVESVLGLLAPVRPDGPGPETDLGDGDAGTPDRAGAHGVLLVGRPESTGSGRRGRARVPAPPGPGEGRRHDRHACRPDVVAGEDRPARHFRRLHETLIVRAPKSPKAWWCAKARVLSMGVYLGASTTIIDRATGETMRGEVPPYSVVVSGTMPGKPLPNGQPGPNLYCAVIVKRVDEKTRSKTSINELLRD